MEPTTDLLDWGDLLTHVAFPLILFMLGWLLKQNRDAKIQMSEAIKESKESMAEAVSTLTTAVDSVRTELQSYRETWIDRREALIGIITTHCTEAQGACRSLVELQLNTLKEKQDTICGKIDDLKTTRNEQWKEQQERNTLFQAHMNDSGIHKVI